VDGSVVNGRTYTYHLIALIQKKNDGSLIASPASDPTVATPGPEICWLLDDGADRMLTIASDARSVAREVVSIFGARHLAVDRLDGGCWTTTRFGGAEFGPVAIRFTAQGAQDVILTGFTAPASVAVDPRDGSVWIADVGGTLNGVSSVSRLTRRGILFFQRTGFTNPAALAVEPGTGDCWVADRGAGVLKRISTNGDIVATAGPIGLPGALAVDPADGDCWGIDESAKTVFRVGPDGTRLATIGGFNSPERIAFNAYSNALWITEPDAGRVILLNADAPDGYHLDQRPDFHSVITGFVSPADVSVDPVSGNVWIPDSEGRSLYKMGPDGRQKQRLSGIPFPVATAVDPGPR
jgi:hypothetical protein